MFRLKYGSTRRDASWHMAAWHDMACQAPRRRPCNYAEAAGGHRIPAEVQELMMLGLPFEKLMQTTLVLRLYYILWS